MVSLRHETLREQKDPWGVDTDIQSITAPGSFHCCAV